MPTSRGSSGGGHVMYGIFLNAFEWALPMNAYPSMPTPISAIGRDTTQVRSTGQGEQVANAVKWGILSTADINRKVIPGAHASPKVDLVAVASRDQARAEEYAKTWEIERA